MLYFVYQNKKRIEFGKVVGFSLLKLEIKKSLIFI